MGEHVKQAEVESTLKLSKTAEDHDEDLKVELGDFNSHSLKLKTSQEIEKENTKVCIECKVEKHGRKFGPGCKKCRTCCYKQQKEKQSQDPTVCVECKVEKHGLS